MASREELLQSIQPGMKLDKAFFLKVYGYEISFPGFRDIAIRALEDAGCSKARSYYDAIVAEYERKYQEGLKEAAEWYSKQLDQKWEKKERTGEKSRKQETIQNLTKKELTELCKKLLQEGIITSPEQFATAVGLDQ